MIQNQMINGSFTKTLLWENQNPTSPRSQTDCNLSDDFNNYDELLFVYYKTTSDLIEIKQKIYPENINFQVVGDYASVSPSYFNNGFTTCRRIKMTYENNYKVIQFSSCWGMNGSVSNDNSIIPIKIYGIKYTIPMEENI